MANVDLLTVLNKLLNENTIKTLANKLNLAHGTITRWIELKDVPKSYEFDLLKLSRVEIDYSIYPSKQKDQFFTPIETTKQCFAIFTNEIQKWHETPCQFNYIEPSAGDGSFLTVLPPNRTIALDIEPRHPSVVKQDYLDWTPKVKERYVVFGNPPFGLRGHTALKFINHSSKFAEYVCFILPQLFESDGKGVPRKRVVGFNLIYSEKIATDFYDPENNVIKVNTIFQIWSKNHKNDNCNIKSYDEKKMRVYSMSDGGTIASTRNKAMIGKCDVYVPSTCFGKDKMKFYDSFDELPGRKGYGIVFHSHKSEMLKCLIDINLSEVAFLSTNSAYNLRTSQIYELFNA
jgi:hypothetical protein